MSTYMLGLISLLFSCSVAPIHGFVVPPPSFKAAAPRMLQFQMSTDDDGTDNKIINLADRYYQLEELEDRETATTEILLKADRSIEFGETDGPLPAAYRGRWRVQGDAVALLVERTFTTGYKGTDMGAFSFKTLRAFRGETTWVGDVPAVSGHVYDATENVAEVADLPVEAAAGFFHMIDSTDVRMSVMQNELSPTMTGAGSTFGRRTVAS